MRNYKADDKYDVEEAARLGALPWMLSTLALNPDYNSWGPGEDYMKGPAKEGHGGWDAGIDIPSWAEFEWGQDDLNVVANFHFEIVRNSTTCSECDGSGYHPMARSIVDSFYGGWGSNITLDELQALVDAGRCWGSQRGERVKPVVDQDFLNKVNNTNAHVGLGDYHHDAINRSILIRARCDRRGIPTTCPECGGYGHVFTDEAPHMELVLWFLHPRKGCSRGVTVKNVTQDDLPSVFKYLRKARSLMMARFGRIPAKASK